MSTDTHLESATLAEKLWEAYESPHDQPWVHLSPNDQAPWRRQAEALEKVWEFHLRGGIDHKAEHEKALAELSSFQDDHESKLAEIEKLKAEVAKLKSKAKKAEAVLEEPDTSVGEPGTPAVGED